MGIQRLITTDKQAVTGATASSVKPSSAIKRAAVNRAGNGLIAVSGPYTGDTDTQIDVEIVSGGANRITRPSFSGVGSGSMTDMAVLTGATPQQWVLSVADLGVDTSSAEATIDSIVLRAINAGASGNSISINIDQSGVTYTDSGYSLISDIAEGTETVTGPGFDFDAAVGAETDVPATAKRIAIGQSKTIHRQWKYQKGSVFEYRFLPKIDTDHDRGATVYFVAGGRTVTITDGTTTETYTGIITLYDLLSQIQNLPSALVDVIGVVSDETTVTNPQAVIDLQARTDARLAYTSGDGSEYATGATDIVVGANASTELVTATCIGVSIADGAGIGAEKWALDASVTNLNSAIIKTDELYTEAASKFAFRIPRKVPDGFDDIQRGDISHKVMYADRGDNPNYPAVCVDAMQLGPNAEDKTIRFVYTRRPQPACPCDNIQYAKLPDACLAGGNVADIVANPEYALRKERLRAIHPNDTIWRASIRPQTYRETIAFLLDDIFRGTTSWPEYQTSAAYDELDVFQAGDYKYRVTVAGTSGGSAPVFPTAIGATGTDGTLQYECVSLKPLPWWDNLYDLAKQVSIEQDQAAAEADTAHPFDPISFYDYLFRTRRAILAAADIYLDEVTTDATETTSGCWLQPPDPYWWVPDDPKYLPAFTNNEYHSVSGTQSNPQPTLEFGFVIKSDLECSTKLAEGDTVEIQIGNAGWGATYQLGDKIIVATIAAADIDLSGGIDGTDQVTFTVVGSVDGAAADYVVDKAAPALYDSGQVRARINPGGVPFELGDTYTFCVETGQYRWRQDGGAWSAPTDIAAGALVDGLSVSFTDGACPSFVAGDSASFTALQPHGIASASVPDDRRYAWDGVGTTITLPCAGTVDALAIGMHTLPDAATISVTDGTTTWPMTVRDGVMVLFFDHVLASPTLTITITNAPGADIGWLWAGQALQFDADARNISSTMRWAMLAGAGVNPAGAKRGRGRGWVAQWDGFAASAEIDALETAIDAHKTGGNWPAAWVPAADNPGYASMVVLPDDLEMADWLHFACPGKENIDFSMTLTGWVY